MGAAPISTKQYKTFVNLVFFVCKEEHKETEHLTFRNEK
jgi:hypothetical protein